MDVRAYNRDAWDRKVENGNRWTQPALPELISAARRGEVFVLLTETKPVPPLAPPCLLLRFISLAAVCDHRGDNRPDPAACN